MPVESIIEDIIQIWVQVTGAEIAADCTLEVLKTPFTLDNRKEREAITILRSVCQSCPC
uniref:Uncharacterized protein n=1 Tax=Arion vulgaris TaxID=1028688 RepID=A0A0B7AEA2_9EUPU